MRILIVPDKFKGTLTAKQAAEAIAQGWSQIRPQDILDLEPMADGGEGFGAVFGTLLKAQRHTSETRDFSGQPLQTHWWMNSESRIGLVETAEVIGLSLHSRGKRHPFQCDTFGLGRILQELEEQGVQRLYLGLGGSATNDGGFGLARSIGWTFWDSENREIKAWTHLDQLAQVMPPHPHSVSKKKIPEVTLVVDVENPLLGPRGATRIFGPQKGLAEDELDKAEACLAKLALILKAYLKEDFSNHPGAGAAGGLGFGLKAFYGGSFQSGAEVFSELSKIKSRLLAYDLILTGEGSLDRQSLMGKGVGYIAELASNYGKPCICLSGVNSLNSDALPWKNFRSYSICPTLALREESFLNAGKWLSQLSALAARDWPLTEN